MQMNICLNLWMQLNNVRVEIENAVDTLSTKKLAKFVKMQSKLKILNQFVTEFNVNQSKIYLQLKKIQFASFNIKKFTKVLKKLLITVKPLPIH